LGPGQDPKDRSGVVEGGPTVWRLERRRHSGLAWRKRFGCSRWRGVFFVVGVLFFFRGFCWEGGVFFFFLATNGNLEGPPPRLMRRGGQPWLGSDEVSRRKGSAQPEARRWGGGGGRALIETGRGAGLSVRHGKPQRARQLVCRERATGLALDRKAGAGFTALGGVSAEGSTPTGATWPPTHDIPRPSQASKDDGKKRCPSRWRPMLDCEGRARGPIRMMFQDAASFGPWSCIDGVGRRLRAPGSVNGTSANSLTLWPASVLAWGSGLEFE